MDTETAAPVKVAILGGGMAALAAAWEIVQTPGYEVTIHTLGWRLGGKCASSRGEHDRIEEHGIHGFLGSYYNAFPMLAEVYKLLDRGSDEPLATICKAMVGMNELQMYDWAADSATPLYNVSFPPNTRFPDPTKPAGMETFEALLMAAIDTWERIHHGNRDHGLVDFFDALFIDIRAALAGSTAVPLGAQHPLLDVLGTGIQMLSAAMKALLEPDPKTNQIYTIANWLAAIVYGALYDDVTEKGFDYLDDEDWSSWLRRHYAQPETLVSPIALNTVNLSYQYPHGKTVDEHGKPLPPNMAAGAYLHWSLRGLGYCGQAIYAFAAGTGETVIAPMYLALVARGVKFNFFSKVTALKLSADKTQVASVLIDVQATHRTKGAAYRPLYDAPASGYTSPLASWPARPHYDQLAQGEDQRFKDADLESFWCDWPAVKPRTLTAGVDYDKLVFALSIGAVPDVCPDLMAANTAWQAMYDALPTVKTQAFQIWLREDMRTLGWNVPLNGNDTALSDTYKAPINGHCEMHHILHWENWPATDTPKSLWYFCDVMPETDAPPPSTDHGYPQAQRDLATKTAVAYLDQNIGTLMPLAVNGGRQVQGAPDALDYSLLVGTLPGQDSHAIATQFVRANIDPTERYVQSPHGSTKFRLKPWDTGFSNLLIAGDWTYTGLNVGSVECAVMSGRLVSNAITGLPLLSDIPGYPAG